MNDATNIATTNGTAFDLANVGLNGMISGSQMLLRHPATGAVLKNGAGQDVSITLLSQHSEAFRETMRVIQIDRPIFMAALRKTDKTVGENDPAPIERVFDEDTQLLTAVTVSWTIDMLDGEPIPCTTPNIRRLWTDIRFIHYRTAALNFIMADRNFLSASGNS